MDSRSGETLELTHGQPLYTDGVVILLRSEEDPALEWRPEAVGATLQNERGSYNLAGIDFEAATLTIEKTYPDSEREAETQTLAVQVADSTDAIETENNESADAEPETTVFDGMF